MQNLINNVSSWKFIHGRYNLDVYDCLRIVDKRAKMFLEMIFKLLSGNSPLKRVHQCNF